MGEQNRRVVDSAADRPAQKTATPAPAPVPDTAPEPGSPDAQAVAETRDERQTRRMAPDSASPGEAASE